MSTVLSNGVIVPDVGSTNWASDLETNWTLLNALIGAIGANVRLDRPNIWTAAQTFSEGIYGDLNGTAAMAVSDANGNEIATTYALKTEVTALQTAVASKAADNAVVHLAGAETITGDKTWTGSNAFTNNVLVSDSTNRYLLVQNTSDDWVLGSSTPSSTKELGGIGYRDKNDGTTFYCLTFHDASGNVYTRLNMRWKYTNGVKSTSGSTVNVTFDLGLDNTGNKYVSTNGFWKASLTPYASATYDLGTSTNKWKTLNGINPGDLSIPNMTSLVDISGSLTSFDGTVIDISSIITVPGWINIVIPYVAGDYIRFALGRAGGATAFRNSRYIISGSSDGDFISVFVPVSTGLSAQVNIKASGGAVTQARFYPCLGNV